MESIHGVRFDDEVAEEDGEEDGEGEEKAMEVQKDLEAEEPAKLEMETSTPSFKVRKDATGYSDAGVAKLEPDEVIEEEEKMDVAADEKSDDDDDHATLYEQGLRVRQDAGDVPELSPNVEVKEKPSTPEVLDQPVDHSHATKMETTIKPSNPGATAANKVIPSDADDDETIIARPKGFRRVLGHFVCGCQHRVD